MGEENSIESEENEYEQANASIKHNILLPLRTRETETTKGENEVKDKMEVSCTMDKEIPLSQLISKTLQGIPGVSIQLSKVKDIRIKMVPLLGNIKLSITNNIWEFLSLDEDLERIKQRTAEFEIRFKRNYLFRSKCQLQDIKNMGYNPLKIKSKGKLLQLTKSLTDAHYSANQSLKVIEKQLHSISITRFMQDLLQTFFRLLHQLTFVLKPFLGRTKAQPLDDTENLIVEVINTIRRMRDEQEKKAIRDENTTQKKINQASQNKNKFTWKKSIPYALKITQLKEQVKDLGYNNKTQEQENKDVFFMMLMKDRPGSKFRRCRRKVDEDPKTMIELLKDSTDERDEENDEDFVISNMKNVATERNCHKKNLETDGAKNIGRKRGECKEQLVLRQSGSDGNQESEHSNTFNNLIQFRQQFDEFKKNKFVYSSKSLLAIKKITTRLIDESLDEAVKKIEDRMNQKDKAQLMSTITNK